jgi:hypothetical protein
MEALAPADVDAARWQRIVGQLKANGLSAQATRECLALVQEAVRLGLPADPVLTRIEEGSAKGVEETALQAAGRQRLANLQSAATVLKEAGYGNRCASHDQLMKSVTMALESGLSPDTLQGVLAQSKGGQPKRMQSIVEAGETMRLSGMNEATVGQIMIDFTQLNMRRMEVIRASRFAVQQQRGHVEGARIRQQLWDGSGTDSRWGRGEKTSGAAGARPGAGGPAEQGSGAGGSDARSGQSGGPASPGNEPANAGADGGGPGGSSGSSGSSSGSGGNGPTEAGPQGSTPTQGR